MNTCLRLVLALTLAAAPLSALAQDGGPPQPLMARPTVHVAADCDNPARRKEIVAQSEATLESVKTYMEDYNRFAAANADWKSAQLVAKGAWTKAEAGAFGEAMLKDPTFEALGQDNMKALEGLMGALSPFLEAATGSDDLKTCRTMADFVAAAYGVVDTTEKQWRYLGGKLDAAAKAKGVTLD